LTPQQLEERKAKGLCFNCDSKYSKGHKCGEKKLFYIDCEEEEEQEQEQEPSQDENIEAISSEELTPTISCNALARISTPKYLNIFPKVFHPLEIMIMIFTYFLGVFLLTLGRTDTLMPIRVKLITWLKKC
jgi:hypothetical protein